MIEQKKDTLKKEQALWSSSLPSIIKKWILSRGFKNQLEFEKFTSFQLKDLTSPFNLRDMDRAVHRLVQAFQKNESLCLYGDYDMDGTPGLALLISGLQLLGFKKEKIFYFQPNRFDDGYGVHPHLVEALIEKHKPSLFVTVDVGMTDNRAVELAKQKSVDFIITDHHQPKKEPPGAFAIVNPNQKDCSSGLTYLCGTGVAFYLILALRSVMNKEQLLKKNFDPKKLLDCFTIATLTDMVPLIKENRILVQHGLFYLPNTERMGLSLLMKKLGLLDKPLNSSDITLKLAPKLNALGRMNSPVKALDFFLVNDSKQAIDCIEALFSAQKQRVEIQEKGEELLDRLLLRNRPDDIKKIQKPEDQRARNHFIFEYSEDFHRGVVGLIATHANQKYGIPSFIGSVIDNRILGSARSSGDRSLLKALESSKGYLEKFGGHHQAAGFELSLKEAVGFRDQLIKFYQNPHQSIGKIIYYDFETTLEELLVNTDFMSWLSRLEPYGTGFGVPLIRINHLFVANVKTLKEKHLKFTLKDRTGNKIQALWFSAIQTKDSHSLSFKEDPSSLVSDKRPGSKNNNNNNIPIVFENSGLYGGEKTGKLNHDWYNDNDEFEKLEKKGTEKWSSQCVSLIGEPVINHYMNQKSLQIFIKDMSKEDSCRFPVWKLTNPEKNSTGNDRPT